METSVVTCRGAYLKKGHLLRKKCGQVKLQQQHAQRDIFISGHSLVRLSGVPLYIPTCESIEYMHDLLFTNNSVGTIVILLSVLRSLYNTAKASLRRSLETHLFTLQSAQRIVFLDEFCRSLQLHQRLHEHESMEAYQHRLLISAAQYLASAYSVPVHVIASDSIDPAFASLSTSNLSTITLTEYLTRCNLYDQCKDQYQSMHTRLTIAREQCNQNDNTSSHIYSPHLSLHDALSAIQSQRIYRGTLQTSRFSCREGVVVLLNHQKHKEILVCGLHHINRAMHGDEVAVEILPEEQWFSAVSELRLADPSENSPMPIANEDDNLLDDFDEPITTPSTIPTIAESRTPCGRIISIIRRKVNDIVVTVPRKEEKQTDNCLSQDVHILTIPVDRSYPLIRIRTKQWNLLQGQRIVVSISNWPIDSMYPNGYLVRTLGEANSWESELSAILWKNNIFLRPFSLAALAFLPKVPAPPPVLLPGEVSKTWVDSQWRITEPITDRRDLRTCRDVFSVDPPGCQDIDDAMSVYWVEDGIVEIGVHIADVCAFVQQGSALDAEAQERGTTVYLPHTRVDMLPALIASDIASLHANRDRYSVSVLFHMKIQYKDGTSVKQSDNIDLSTLDTMQVELCMTPIWSGRCVIHSIAAMTYNQAHNLLRHVNPDADSRRVVPDGQAGQSIPESLHGRLRKHLAVLTLVSRTIGKYRFSQGALNLSQSSGTQLKFEMHEGSDPFAVHGHEKLEINSTIEELMILANSAVATIIYTAFPHSALLRTHSPASLNKLQHVADIFYTLGISIFEKTDNKNALFTALRNYKSLLDKSGHASEETLNYVTSVIIRALEEAQYICTSGQIDSTAAEAFIAELGHFGLGLQYYTHFTSPIRRYADVVVHRQLLEVLKLKSQPSVDEAQPRLAEPTVIIPDSLTMELLEKDETTDKVQQTLGISRAPDGRRSYDKVSIIPAEQCTSSMQGFDDIAGAKRVDNEPSHSIFTSSALDSLLDNVGIDFASQPTDAMVFHTDTGVSALDSLLGDVGLEFNVATATPAEALHPSNPIDSLLGDDFCAEDKNELDELLKDVGDSYQLSHRLHTNNAEAGCTGYSTSEISGIASHLNTKNRNAKRAQQECQFMFLCKYFENRHEDHVGVVYSLKENGILVYIPSYDYKGSVYMTDKDGNINLLPSVMNLPSAGALCEYKLVLRKSSEGRPIELVVCPKNQSPVVADIHVLRLQPMQRVRVRITALTRTSSSMPDLSMELIDACDRSKLTNISISSEYKNIYKWEVAGSCNKPVEHDAQKENSLYNYLQNCSAGILEGKEATKLKRKMAAEQKKLDIHRYQLPSTGRVLFASPADARNFFVTHSTTSSATKRDALTQLAIESSMGGKQAAMIKMQQWGEEWAEEEDLPDSAVTDYETEMPDNVLAGRYGKDVAIATQRQQKLKIAKKNSKY